MKYALPFVLTLLGTTAHAQDAEEYIRDNVLSIFYHELGHALIDFLDLPIFGQEEDAADVASVMLIHMLYEEEAAQNMILATGDAFLAEAQNEAGNVAFWGTHGASEQRFYNMICIFYGGDIEARAELAELAALPEDRAAWCETEFEQATGSWGMVLEAMAVEEPSETFVLGGQDETASVTLNAIREELTALNNDFGLSEPLVVNVESCGEANAFYDPETKQITMCTEFEDYLREIYESDEG